jgi:hypothetical protein
MVYVLVHRRTFPVFLSVLSLVGCDRDVTAPATPPYAGRLFCQETLGVCFEIPSDWHRDVDGAALTFAGPRGTDDFYTVLSLQGMPDAGEPLDLVLDTIYAGFATGRRFQWIAREPLFVSGRPALAYSLELDLDESARRRVGLLVAGDEMLVDLAYSAVPSLFWNNLSAYLQAQDTLAITGRAPRPTPLVTP